MLTPNQLSDLKADIESNTDQEVIDALANGNDTAIAEWYNRTAVPDHYIWETNVNPMVVESLGFDWAQVDNLANTQPHKLEIWKMMRSHDSLDASEGNVRQGVNQAFTKDSDLWNSVWPNMSRLATNAEKLFAGGNKNGLGPGIPSDSPDQPRNPKNEGPITSNDVRDALNS